MMSILEIKPSSFKDDGFAKSAQHCWAFFFACMIFCGISLLHAQSMLSGLALCISAIAFALFGGYKVVERYHILLMAFAIIYFQSIVFSNYTSRSITLSQSVITSFFVFCVLVKLHYRSIATKSGSRLFPQDLVLVACMLIQSSIMISGYVENTGRQTGLLLDYSQSSFFLLLIYGYLYLQLKNERCFPLLTFIVALAIFTSFSRTTNFLLAVFILSLIVFRVYTREHSIKGGTIVAIVFALVFLHLVPVILGSDAVDRGGLQDFTTLNSRTQYWSLAWQAIMEKPLLGHGLGNFEYLGAKDSFPNQKIFFVHNDYLQIWMELGVIWFFLFIYLVGYLVIKHRQVTAIPLGVRGDLKRYIDWVLLCCCAAYMTINFIIGSLIFLLLIALIISRLTTYGEN